jgi:predicted DNA-binding transcriptional regulator YafY
MTPPIPKERLTELRRQASIDREEGLRFALVSPDELLALLDAAEWQAELGEGPEHMQCQVALARVQNARFKDARNAALEEAAQAVERFNMDPYAVAGTAADAIRALKEKP